MSKVHKVLIIGGGTGGLSAAIALKRKGIEAEIIEQDPALQVCGVGSIQPSNVLRAMRSLDLGDACIKHGQGFLGWHFCDAQGRMQAQLPSENVAGPGYPPVNGISKPALHKILTDAALAHGIRIRFGVTATKWTDLVKGVHVSFSDGTQQTYDLVIGADGTYSKTRSRLFGNVIRPQFTGQGVWHYQLQRPHDMNWGSLHYGKESKAGLVPLSESMLYLFLVTAEPGNPRMPADRLHLLMRKRLEEYGGIVGRLRDLLTDPAAVTYKPVEVVMAPFPWYRGRVMLIGEAARSGPPHLADAASMAIEDAVLLADLLAAAPDIKSALKRFALRRLPRALLSYETGLCLGEWERAESAGTPDASADHFHLFSRAYSRLMAPI
jgi:2-polyprenyl-6-methoxyphenol hydroxylase-like FAD-dependent oxidoreductase